MKTALRRTLLQSLDGLYQTLGRAILFRQSAQDAHDSVIRLLRWLDGIPLAVALAKTMREVTFAKTPTEVGGVTLSQRMILAAGLVKGDGFADEDGALRAVTKARRNIIPGWRIVPALVGPVEFGSFTRHPRHRQFGDGDVAG